MSQSGLKFRSSSVRSLKSSSIQEPSKLQIISKNPFEINPSHIVFKDIEQEKDYQVKVEIRNLTKKPQRIRFDKFKNPRFTLEAVPQAEIAVGLSVSVTVRYECFEEVAEFEVLKIQSSDGFTQELSINTYPKKSKIVFDPFVNLGFVEQNTQCTKQIVFENQGEKAGQLKFVSNYPALLSVQPQTISLGAKASSTLTIKYKPSEAGYFKGIVEIKSTQPLAKNFIEVVATSLEKARFIVNPNKTAAQQPDMLFDFRTVYAGQKKVLKAFLINNSPKPMKFKTLTKKGLLQNAEEVTMNSTPAEQAHEEREKVFSLVPEEGTVEAFAEFELELKCESKPNYKENTYVASYAMADYSQQGAIASMRNAKDFRHEKFYEYTAIVKSEEQKPLLLHLKATVTCPEIKISKKSLLFGDCLLHETKKEEIVIENRNKSEKVTISLPKIPYIDFVPAKFVLQSERSKRIEVIFRPKVIGIIDETQLIIINQVYEIPLRCMGIVTNQRSMSQKQLSKLSLEDNKAIQSPRKQMLSRRFSVFQTQKSTTKPLQNQPSLNYLTHRKLGSLNSIQPDPKTKAISLFVENKEKFSKLLTSRRQDREKKQAEREMKEKYSQMKEKLEKQKKNEIFDEEGLPESSPVDVEFELGSMRDIREKEPKLSREAETLFVTKHIGSYQPKAIKSGGKSSFSKSTEDAPKRILPETPQIFNQRRQISRQLSVQQLELIQVPQTKIYFGQVYVKSECTRYFWLKNSTRCAISCRVVFEAQEMAKSYPKAQTVPSYQEAAFPLVLCRHSVGEFVAEGEYIINQKYRYKLSVVAKIGEVVINVNKENLKFEFPQNNLEMTMVETLLLTNPGNSQAKFRWSLGKEKYFVPQMVEGVIQAKQSVSVPIELNLSAVMKSLKKQGDIKLEEKISLKILQGQEKSVSCVFQMLQPKYSVKCDLFTRKSIIFVQNQLSEFVEIKNTTKQAILLHLTPQNVQILSSEKLRLMPDETKKIRVKFMGDKVGEFQCGIGVSVRGGTRKEFEFCVKVVEPEINFSTEQLHMEPLIVRSTRGEAFFTLSHKEQLPIPLVFDLRPKKYNKSSHQHIQHLELQLLNQGQSLATLTPTLKSEQDQNIINQNLVDQKIDIDEIEDQLSNQSFDDEEETLEKDELELRRYRLVVRLGVEYRFRLEFVAPQVGVYKIGVPIEVEKSIKISNSPVLVCEAIQPKFIFEPSNIDFKKKYIGRPERSFPKVVEVLVKNDNYESIEWTLDCQELQDLKIFSFEPKSGCLQPHQQTRIRAIFNPFSVGQFEKTIPLYIRSQKQQKRIKFCSVSLKGTSSEPQIYFNKREVIMPVVPLGIETSTFFRILNDGYDNLNLSYEFEDDVMGLDVKVGFPEGNNIGISRQKLRVDLGWKYDKPMSFTLLLTFKDDMGRRFTVPVSGTTDNSILTNYMYLLRNENKFRVKDEGALQLFELTHNQTMTSSLQRKHSSHSLKSNSTNRSIMSYLGIAPINPYVLATTLEYIKKYLNQNLLTISIGEFPQSIVQNDGKPILEVLAASGGKAVKYPWVYQGSAKGEEKVKKLMVQYTQLIKLLKVQGAMLNHIRPEYLLSFHDLNLYLSTLPAERTKCYMPNLLKINSGLYNYLSVESWTSLLYQILKINLISRVSPKNIKTHVPFYRQKEIPAQYLERSNFLSVNESILLHWCEQAYHEVLFKEIRLMNFDKDFRSGIVIGAIIQRYARNGLTARLIPQPKSQQDEKKNAKTICDALQQMGLLGHIQPKYIYSPFQREMVLLIMYLYMYLPAYIPKEKPIVFQCVLGEELVKSIELKNPSSKPLKYKAKYVGSTNFVLLSDETFTIQPKSSYDFKIKYISRFVKQIKGRISFVNLKDKTTGQGNSMSGSTVVFELKSQTVQVLSEKTWKVSSNLYEPSEYTVQVENNIEAPQNTQFVLKVRTEYVVDKKKKSKGGEDNSALSPQEQVQVILFKSESVKVKKGSIQPLSFTYLPLSLHKTKTYILFSNQFFGEFQHEIQATAQEPALTAQFKPNLTMYSGNTYDWEYVLTAKNEFLQKAKKTYEGLVAKKTKGNGANSPAKSKIKLNSQSQETKEMLASSKMYEIEIEQNQNVNLVDKFVTLSEEVKKDKKAKNEENPAQQQQSTPQNCLKFKFTCKQPIFEFPLKIRLRDPKSQDIRLYRLILTILPKPLSAVLQMTTPQRKQLIQELPFINHTEKDWNMKVNWSPGNGFMLGGNCASGFVVKRQSVFKLPVIFKPKLKEDSEAKLVVMNPMTLDQFEYLIKGHVEDPLSQDHIDIQCGINQPVTRSVKLVNSYPQKSISLRVETDIPNFQGDQRLTIPPNGKLHYPFKLTAMICGEFNSCITFWEVEGSQYFWFTVSVRTSVGSAALCVDVETEIRQRKMQKIRVPVNFRLKGPEEFEVSIKGQGLLGPQKITLHPQGNGNKQGTNIYSLQYLPLKQGTSLGSLYFVNPRVGQVMIDLNLTCHPKPPHINHLIKSPLGVGSKEQIVLQNPINAKISIQYKNSNPETFVVLLGDSEEKKQSSQKQLKVIRLMPFEKKVVKVEYIPGSIDSVQKTEIVFFSEEVGEWEYHFSGIGVAPTEFEPLVVYRQLGEMQQSSVKFRNPFNYAISVGIKLLVQPEWQLIFRLNLLGKQILNIDPHGNIEVPFLFVPESIAQYFCSIRILLSDKIFWTFPIVGVAERMVKETQVTIKAKCREIVRIEKHFHLQGVEKFANNNNYRLKFLHVPHDMERYVNLFLEAELTKKSLQSDKDELVAEFLFKPMKPFKTAFDLSIERENGGRWIYKVHVEASPPEIDDRIELESAIMSTSSVSFKLTNKDKKVVPFRAYFTTESAHEFSVQPSEGQLAKYGSKGTEIKLAFTPVEYGKDKAGRLVIETDEMYWSYEVVGRLPKYVPPVKKSVLEISRKQG